MDQSEISSIQPVSEARASDEVTRPAEAPRERESTRVNSRMPWAAQLDLGTGIQPMAYAEYTGHAAVDRVSIKIIDPATGAVIRELPSQDLMSFSEALTAYVDLGRRHGGPL